MRCGRAAQALFHIVEPQGHPGEVHLTIGEVRYDMNDRGCKGVASCYLAERLSPGGLVGVYVQKSAHFHPPSDDDCPLIMIGPGTGIAPFRAFLEEREARGAKGENWLFFGDQHESCDYLYHDQIQDWSARGVLDKLSLAWSRDGADKVYVQTLLEREADEVFAWLERGAAIYICGDASRMAVDVEAALLRIIARGLGGDVEAAREYLDRMAAIIAISGTFTDARANLGTGKHWQISDRGCGTRVCLLR